MFFSFIFKFTSLSDISYFFQVLASLLFLASSFCCSKSFICFSLLALAHPSSPYFSFLLLSVASSTVRLGELSP